MQSDLEEQDPWLAFRERLLKADQALTVEMISQMTPPLASQWQLVRDSLDRHSSYNDSDFDSAFLKRITIDMLDVLPANCRTQWWEVWEEYSLLMKGTDLKMLSGMAANETAEWDKFCRMFKPRLERQLRAMFPSGKVGDMSVDDLVQEVNVRLIKKIGTFRRQRFGSFRSFVRVISAHIIDDQIRSSMRRDQHESAYRQLKPLFSDNSPQSMQWDQEHRLDLFHIGWEKVKGSLSKEHISVYEAHQQGLSNAEIAEKFGISKESSRQIRHRVSSSIKQLLEQWGEL